MEQLKFDINRPWLTLDPWQKEYIKTIDQNCFLLCGRQSGKSTAMSIKIGECAVKEKAPCDYLVVAFTENQAYALFFKALRYLQARYPQMIKMGRDKPTQHEINLTNGVTINCYACGKYGDGLRHWTLKRLFVDEAAPMNREIFTSITPMLSVTSGLMDISSTPRGKEGYFYECSLKDNYKKFYISAEDCPRHSKEFLESEKKSMSSLEYAQEYLAVFLSEFRRFFPEDLIKECCVLKRPRNISRNYQHFLGVDVARLGSDLITFEIIKKLDEERFEQVESIVDKKKRLNETYNKILELNKLYDFKEIGVDDGGIGVGVFDYLLAHPDTKRKINAINNAYRVLDKDEKKKKHLLKEDLYNNLLGMMERGEIKLLDDNDLMLSLASVQFEYIVKAGRPTVLKLFSPNHDESHIVEGLIRSAWLCNKSKHLSLWCSYS